MHKEYGIETEAECNQSEVQRRQTVGEQEFQQGPVAHQAQYADKYVKRINQLEVTRIDLQC